MAVGRLVLVLAITGFIGCADEKSYTALLRFDPSALSQRIDRIELSLVSSCYAEEELGPAPLETFKRVQLERGSDPAGLGRIDDGEYNLYARGFGPCVAAAGCAPIEITPAGVSTFEVTLHEVPASKYDPALVDNGGCPAETVCTEEGTEAVCVCEMEGYVFDGTACVPPSGQNETFLSDWRWMRDTNLWGPVERDLSNGGYFSADGGPMRLRGTTHDRGIGVSAPSEVRVNLDQRCTRFLATLGVDDATATNSKEAYAEVWLDGEMIYESSVMTRESPPESIDVRLEDAYELRLITVDANPNDPTAGPDSIDWAEARIVCDEGWRGDALESSVSDWEWISEDNGLGPVEHDQSNGGEGTGDGAMIELAGTTYERGLGVHAPSVIEIDLADGCHRFRSDLGVDDEVSSGGSVVFQVWADDEMLFESGTLTALSRTAEASVDLRGHSRLRLVVLDGGDGTEGDHADWAGASLLCKSGWQGRPVDTYVSDWVFLFANDKWGPIERDMDAGGEPPYDGGPLEIDDVAFARGLGTLAPSELRINLAEQCTRFRASIGVDDSAVGAGKPVDVDFRVVADGLELFQSESKELGDPAEMIDIDVTGRSMLVLSAGQAGDTSDWDYANWANARLTCEIGAIGLP